MLNVISIDPAKNTGIYVKACGVEDWIMIKNKAKVPQGKVLVKIYQEFRNILSKAVFDIALIEGYARNPKNRNSVSSMGEVNGVIKMVLTEFDIPFVSIPVPSWKCLTIGQVKKSNKKNYLKAAENVTGIQFDSTDVADAYMIYLAVSKILKKTKYLSDAERGIKEQVSSIIKLAKLNQSIVK